MSLHEARQNEQKYSINEEAGNGNNMVSRDKETDEEDLIDKYQTTSAYYNGLEDSISFIEKSAKKVCPIYQALLTKLIPQKDLSQEEALFFDPQLYNDTDDSELAIKTEQAMKGNFHVYDEEGPDMRHILGFLNQSEWVNTLNIGNIMQLAPI
jgi:hypothetical protein